MYQQPQTNSFVSLLALLARAIIAYVLAFWLYIFLFRLTSSLRDYGLRDATAASVVLWALLTLAILVLLVPVLQAGWGAGLKVVGLMAAFMLLLVALGHATGIVTFDPNAPLAQIVRDDFLPWLFHSGGLPGRSR